MSIYRDESLLKRLVADNRVIEQNAQLYLFMLVEQKLRKIIQEAIKYQIHFRHKQLSSCEVELAIKDQNTIKSDILGFQYMDSINLTKRQDEFILNDQEYDLKDLICHQLKTVRLPIGYPQFTLFTVLKDNQMVNQQETQNILQYKDIMQQENKQIDEQKKSFSIIRDNVMSILSPHQYNLLKHFHSIFEEEVISLQLNYSVEFVQLLNDLQNYKDVGELLPFIVQYLYEHQEGNQLYMYKNRKTILYCIASLVFNNHINLEYHLHYLIKILVNFIVSHIYEISITSVIELQNQTARCLNYLIDRYKLKYFTLKSNMDSTFIKKLDELEVVIKTQNNEDTLILAYSLIEYFGQQAVEQFHLRFVQTVCSIIQNTYQLQQQQQVYQNGCMEIESEQLKFQKQVKHQQIQQLQYLIELQFQHMILKIINGLQYLMPDMHENAWIIVQNCYNMLKSLGKEESLLILSRGQDNVLL